MSKKKNELAIVESNLPAVYDFGEDGPASAEITRDEITIPFLTVLQALSPQVAGEAPVEGAAPGKLFNTVTGEMFDADTGVIFVPACRHYTFVEWIPRDNGGGFVAMHEPTSDVVTDAKNRSEQFGVYSTPEGNDLIETFYLYGVLVSEDGEVTGPVCIAATSTKITPYKKIMTAMGGIMVPTADGGKMNPPLWANALRITAINTKNRSGQPYKNFAFTHVNGDPAKSILPPTHPAYVAARELRTQITSGAAKADVETERAADTGGDGVSADF